MNLHTRIIHTHDTEENWNKCANFIPKCGELIVYDSDDEHNYQRFKIGDGVTTIINLPFTIDTPVNDIVDRILSETNDNIATAINKVSSDVRTALNTAIDNVVRETSNTLTNTLNTKDGIHYIDGGRITDNH